MDINIGIGISEWELKAWIERLGSVPKERIAHEDYAGSYETLCASVFLLENGQYALVTESGCSCYSAEDADIDLYPTKEMAMEQFQAWDKNHKREDHERY